MTRLENRDFLSIIIVKKSFLSLYTVKFILNLIPKRNSFFFLGVDSDRNYSGNGAIL